MRLRLTARRVAGHPVDITVTADATAAVADIAESLARADTQLAPLSSAAPLTLRVEPPDGGTPRDAIVAPEGQGFEEGHSSLDNLKVEYWIWCEDEKLLLYVVCASPWIPVAESILMLFDALVNTLVVDVEG